VAKLAFTTNGSRTFSGGVSLSWTPNPATPADTVVGIAVGSEPVWQEEFIGDDQESVNVSGDIYSITGTLTVVYGASGTSGQLDADLSWTVAGNSHVYQGFVGGW
jgi:hypothetical protein